MVILLRLNGRGLDKFQSVFGVEAELTGNVIRHCPTAFIESYDLPANIDHAQTPVLATETIDEFKVKLSSNSMSGDTIFIIQLDGVDTALTVTFAAAETGIKTIIVNVSALENQLLSICCDTTASLAAGRIQMTGILEINR